MLVRHRNSSFALLFAAMMAAPSPTLAAQTDFKQTVLAAPFSADVWILPTGPMDYEIYVTFHSADLSRPAGCMSVYRDFVYELIEDNGAVIPVDRQARARPPTDVTIVLHAGPNDLAGHGTGHCGEVRGFSQSGSRTFISTLYPHLRAGAYTLVMTFTPHWGAERVPLSKIRIVLPTGVKP